MNTKAPTPAATTAPRPPEDIARDPGRKPSEVVSFFGVKPGMTVVDLMTGRGYYAEFLSPIVGPRGRVYAQNTKFVIDRFADAPLNERLKNPAPCKRNPMGP